MTTIEQRIPANIRALLEQLGFGLVGEKGKSAYYIDYIDQSDRKLSIAHYIQHPYSGHLEEGLEIMLMPIGEESLDIDCLPLPVREEVVINHLDRCGFEATATLRLRKLALLID